MSTEEFREIPKEHIWKPPEYEQRLPELLEKAHTVAQLFKVWKGDRPRCEIETKAGVAIGQARLAEGDAASVHEVWEFRFDHRAGTDFWRVLAPIVSLLGQPIRLTMTGRVRSYTLSGDPDTPFVKILAWWRA